MNNYPEWQKNIREAQATRDERRRQKEEAERLAREKFEAEQQKVADEQFAFTLSKLLGVPVELNANHQYVAEPYTFNLRSVRQYTIRYHTDLFIDCDFDINRAQESIQFKVIQRSREGVWSDVAAMLADYLDDLDNQVAKTAEKAKIGETALDQYEKTTSPTCGKCGSTDLTFIGLDDPMVPAMRIYKCNKCGGEVLDHATNEDGAIAWGGYDPIPDYDY